LFDDDETVDSLTAYLSSEPESSSEEAVETESRPDPQPQDDEQSSEEVPEVAPEEPAEQAPDEEPAVESPPGEESPPEPPSAVTPNWDSDENPHLAASRQLEQIRQLAEQQKAEKEASERKERYTKAIGSLASDVDAEDIPALASDLFEQIAEDATQPLQEEVQRIAHGMTALVAAVRLMPPDVQRQIESLADKNRNLGQTAAEIERAFAIQQDLSKQTSERETKLAKEVKALKAQLAAAAIKQSGSERTEATPVVTETQEPTSMMDYLLGADDDGRSLKDPYGRSRRIG
jgi:hypothetical protein